MFLMRLVPRLKRTRLFTFDQTDTIRRFPYTADVTTLGTGAGVIRHKQEAAGFGPQQPQRRSHSASEAAATAVLT